MELSGDEVVVESKVCADLGHWEKSTILKKKNVSMGKFSKFEFAPEFLIKSLLLAVK